MRVTVELDKKTYWELHKEISDEFKAAYPQMKELNRGIYFWNTFAQILAKKGIIIMKKDEEE